MLNTLYLHNIFFYKRALPHLFPYSPISDTVFCGPKGSSDHPSPDICVELSSFIPICYHRNQISLLPLLSSAILEPAWELSSLLPKSYYVSNEIFHTFWVYVLSVSTSKPNFGWRVHSVSVVWWQQLRRLRCFSETEVFFLSFLAFELALLYAGEDALWATAIWLACALTLLLCATWVSDC